LLDATNTLETRVGKFDNKPSKNRR